MSIHYNEQKKLFKLDAKGVSYVFRILHDGFLTHLYYGAYIPDDNLPDFERRPVYASFSAQPDTVEPYSFSPDTCPMEIGCNGGGDCRFNFNIDLVEDTEKFTYLLQFIDEVSSDQEAYTWEWFGVEGEDFDYVEYGDLRVPTRYPINAEDTRTPIHQQMANAFNFNVSHPDLQKFKNQLGFTFVDQLEGEWYRDVSLVNAVKESLPSAVDYKTECDKILAEGYIAIITGEKDVDFFDEMVENWYAAGGKVLTEEANEIYHSK